MRRLLKKMSAVLLTAAMVTGMCLTSFATSTPAGGASQSSVTENSTATITVGVSSADDESANGGDDLLAYKVVDIKYETAGNRLDYSFTALFDEFLASDLGTTWAGLTPETYAELTEDELKPLLGNFAAYIKQQEPVPAGDYEAKANESGVATFANVAMGQYIILGKGSSNGAKIYQTVTAEVNPEVVDGVPMLWSKYTVAMKTSTPSIEKNITEGTVEDQTIPTTDDKKNQTSEIGKPITYELTVNVPTYPENATNQTFYVGDILSKGLTLDANSIAVKGISGGVETELALNTEYVTNIVLKNGEGEDGTTALYVDFDFDGIAKYDKVIITYKAALNKDAVIGTIGGNPNNVDLIYSNAPFDGNTWVPGNTPEDPDRPNEETPGFGQDEDDEVVYTYGLVIDKFEEKHEDEKLSGAEFEIYRSMDDYNSGENVIAAITTDANGAARHLGLEKGTYYLKETVAPAGFNLMTEPVIIEIDGTKIPYYTETEKTVKHYTYTTTNPGGALQAILNGDPVWMNANGEVKTGEAKPDGFEAAYVASEKTTVENVIEISRDPDNANGFYKAGVSNNKGAQLPSTGGIGTTIFTVIGLLLMIGAGIVMITRRRMSGREL